MLAIKSPFLKSFFLHPKKFICFCEKRKLWILIFFKLSSVKRDLGRVKPNVFCRNVPPFSYARTSGKGVASFLESIFSREKKHIFRFFKSFFLT